MDSDNNASDSEPTSNPASPASSGGTSSPVATRSNDSVKSHSGDSSLDRSGPQSPMPEEEVKDGPQSPTRSFRSRSISASRSGPESPPGDSVIQPPLPPVSASTNGGANAGSDGEEGSVSSSSSSDGRKPGSSVNRSRSRSSSRGSRHARRQANLDDGITTSEEDSESGGESSRSSGGSADSGKDDKDDRNRRLRSPPPIQQQRPQIDVQAEAISDGDMESESSDDDGDKLPSPKPPTTPSRPQSPPPPQHLTDVKSKDPDSKKPPLADPSTITTNPPTKELNLTHDDLSDVSDLDDDDSMGGGDSDKKDESDDEEGRCSDGEVRKKVGKEKNAVDDDGIQSPVNEVDKGDCRKEGKREQNEDTSVFNRRDVCESKPTEPNSTNRTNQQVVAAPASKPLHPRITHDNNNGDDNDEEQLDFEAEDGEQQDLEESSEANKDNNANTNSSADTNSFKERSIDKMDKQDFDNNKSSKQQKTPLLPTPTSTGQTSKDASDGRQECGNKAGNTVTSNGKVIVKEPIELEEGEVSDEDEARPEETEPRPVCRFFSRGQCTWGASCRFLHPGVTDKGHYTMFEVVRPTLLSEYGTVPPNARVPSLLDDPRIQPPHGAPQQPPIESAWERGLRTAKEMLRKSIKRKEQDMDFEEKKMNMTLAQQQDEEEDGLRDTENGGGYFIPGSGRLPSAIAAPIHDREPAQPPPPPVSSHRHRAPPAEIRDRDMDAIYGRESALRMEQQQRHLERLDHRHLDRLERIAAADAQGRRGGGGGGGMMVVEREHRRSRGEDTIGEEYYPHQVLRSTGRFQMAGGQIVPAHHLVYQEEYSGGAQRSSIHPPSTRSYSRHPTEIPQHHPVSHLAPTSYREHRLLSADYYHEQRSRETSKYMHAASPLDGNDSVIVSEPHREGRESRSRVAAARREVIVQRAEIIEQQQQQQQVHRERGGMEGYRMAAAGRHPGMVQVAGARPDEWADPWMRSKSPGGGRTGGGRSKTGKKRSYSSASSYSSSSNSSSRSHSTSRSSARSSLKSRSRSPHGHHRGNVAAAARHSGARGGRGGGRQAVSPSVIVSERKAANERAAAMNPPAPRRSNKAPSPAKSMMRAGAQNPPAPHQPHQPHQPHHQPHHSQPPPPTSQSSSSSSRNKLVLAAAALAARKQHQRVAAVAAAVAATGARRGSSSGSSTGSSSDSDSSTGSSSGSEDGSSGSGGSRGRRGHNRRNASSSTNAITAGTSASGPNTRELALGLALKQAKAIDALKSSGGGGAQEKRSQIKLNLKAPLNAGNAKKRPAPSSPPGASSGGSTAGPDAKKKGSSSRREELLKQLKAVEDAIAKKRSKV